MAKKNWIAGAVKNPGALTRAAAAAGKSIQQFCASPNLDTTNKRRCALAKTLKKLGGGKSK